jgi:large subunit ribosomal protein L23
MNQERLMKVVLAPHVSEKSSAAADRDKQFVFRVVRDADKGEIKNAIEMLFNVEVDAVRTTNVAGKRKRVGGRSDWKKAYVSLKPGFDINFMDNK